MNRLRFAAKFVIHGAMDLSGWPRYCRQKLRGHLIILTYHSFSTDWPRGLFNSLPIHRFEKQVQFLKKHFHLVSLEQGTGYLKESRADDKPWLAITIDDGFLDNYLLAWPVLKRYAVPATIFVATDFIDTGRPPWPTQLVEILERTEQAEMQFPFKADLKRKRERGRIAMVLKQRLADKPPEQRFAFLKELSSHLAVSDETHYPALTWDQIREMNQRYITFGSHTVYHSILTAVDRETVKMELKNSRDRLEKELNKACRLFAYPDGKHSTEIKPQIEACGFTIAVTQDRGSNIYGSQNICLKRIEVPFHDPSSTFHGRVCLAW